MRKKRRKRSRAMSIEERDGELVRRKGERWRRPGREGGREELMDWWNRGGRLKEEGEALFLYVNITEHHRAVSVPKFIQTSIFRGYT